MEITALNIYLLSTIGSVKTFIEAGSICGIIISIVLIIFHIGECTPKNEKETEKMVRRFIKLFFLSILFLFLSCFIPSQKTIAAMYILPKISNSQLLNKIPDYIQKYIESYLEEIKK